MRPLITLAGVALLLGTMLDAFATTLHPRAGAGLWTAGLARGTWRLAGRARGTGPGRVVLRVVGPVILLATVASWILGLWAGWSLVFLAVPEAIVDSRTGAPADAWSRVYFAGFTVFTLGIGDYVPGSGLWQVATVVAVANGLFLVTLSITYLIPVVTAVVSRRQQAAMLSALGQTVEDFVERAWDGSSFDFLTSQLPTLASGIVLTAERHLAYPVLHYFQASQRDAAYAPSVAVLDEAVSVLEHGVDARVRPHPAALQMVRVAVDQTLGILPAQFVGRGGPLPPPPSRQALTGVGVPLTPEQEYTIGFDGLAGRRRQLAAFVDDAGWSWDDVRRRADEDRPD